MRSPVRPFAWASLVANIVIVLTGGAVRLTGSGLGCPTWPRCTAESYVAHESLGFHGAIEFGNRLLTFVLVAVAVATLVVAWRQGRSDLRRLAVALALGIPAQAVIGGITVLTGLDPWIVAFHLLVSMLMIAVAVALVRATYRSGPVLTTSAETGGGVGRSVFAPLAWATLAATWVVLYLGTVVTGSGPHAGDLEARRNGLDPAAVSQAHADAVFLLVGLTLALFLVTRVTATSAEARRAAATLLVLELAQGALGFVQYATGVPIGLVMLHLLGAALICACATWLLLALLRPTPGAGTQPTRGTTGTAEHSSAPAPSAASAGRAGAGGPRG